MGARRTPAGPGLRQRKREFGAFVFLTGLATARTRTRCVGGRSSRTPPALAFSPDGEKLACTIREEVRGAIRILAVPRSGFDPALTFSLRDR